MCLHPPSSLASQEGIAIEQPCYSYYDSPALHKARAPAAVALAPGADAALGGGVSVANQTIHVMVYQSGSSSDSSGGGEDRSCDCQVTA